MLLELYQACPDLFYMIVKKVPFNDYVSIAQTCIQFRRVLMTHPTRNIWQWYDGDYIDSSKNIDNKEAYQHYVQTQYYIETKSFTLDPLWEINDIMKRAFTDKFAFMLSILSVFKWNDELLDEIVRERVISGPTLAYKILSYDPDPEVPSPNAQRLCNKLFFEILHGNNIYYQWLVDEIGMDEMDQLGADYEFYVYNDVEGCHEWLEESLL